MLKTAPLFLKSFFALACLAAMLTAFFILATTSTSYAQSQGDSTVKPLGEILNPKPKDYDENTKSKERGNIYYKKCMQSESLAFDEEEKTLLCACTAAKIPEVLTGPEFAELYKDTKAGRNARIILMTYAYTDCMDQAVSDKVYKDCLYGKELDGIIYGKKNICRCVAKEYNDLLIIAAPDFFMDAIKYDPMTLNPLERHFISETYFYNLKRYSKACRARLLYEKSN